MALFSQRAEIRPLSKVLQRESIDEDLRNALWTSFHDTFVKAYYLDTSNAGFPFYQYQPELDEWLRELWTKFYKAPSDTRPKFQEAIEHIRGQFFEAQWHWVFDFLEFSVKNCKTIGPLLARHANLQLERENSAYRFLGSEIVEITDQNEIDSAEEALSGPKVVRLHLERAITLLSDRRAPTFEIQSRSQSARLRRFAGCSLTARAIRSVQR